MRREREGLERSHARAMEAAKAAAADERSAWRAAVTEKVKRQAAQREEQLRALLLAERDGELQQVILRLQQEQAAALEDAKQQVSWGSEWRCRDDNGVWQGSSRRLSGCSGVCGRTARVR